MHQQEKKGKKGQKQGSGSSLQTVRQTRSPEERFRMQQEAQAQGVQEPDAAFEQRLESLRKSAKSRTQVYHLRACMAHFCGISRLLFGLPGTQSKEAEP